MWAHAQRKVLCKKSNQISAEFWKGCPQAVPARYGHEDGEASTSTEQKLHAAIDAKDWASAARLATGLRDDPPTACLPAQSDDLRIRRQSRPAEISGSNSREIL
jgi:hypothetical protein